MIMLRLRLVFALIAFALTAGSLAAQKQKTKANPNRSGQWIGFGIGPGVGRVGCDICETNRRTSFSGYFKAGGTLSRRWLLGVETDVWMRGANGVNELLAGLAGEFYFYPNPHKRLFYKGGPGVLFYQATDGDGRLSSTAFGVNFGAGYDMPMNKSVSWTPFVSLWIASFGSGINFNGEPVLDGVSLMLFQTGVGVSWH